MGASGAQCAECMAQAILPPFIHCCPGHSDEEQHLSRVQSRQWCGGECAQSSITLYKHSDEERHLSRQAVTNELRQQLSS